MRDLIYDSYSRIAFVKHLEPPGGIDYEVVGRLRCSWLAESLGPIDSKRLGGESRRVFFLI